jgi:large subunit ribosomal protein L34
VSKGKRTFQPNNRRRARTHGFRLRMRTRAGRAIHTTPPRKGREKQ